MELLRKGRLLLYSLVKGVCGGSYFTFLSNGIWYGITWKFLVQPGKIVTEKIVVMDISRLWETESMSSFPPSK